MNERSKQIRRKTIKLLYEYGMSHYGGSLSCVEILIALYDHILTKDDVFLLSKGHCCAPLYVLLREKGLNPKIDHHPKRDVANGIHSISGSLGHGFSFGIGIAMAKQIKQETGRVFVLLGDGCVQEGTFWESIQILHRLQLHNIKIIIDKNNVLGSDSVMNDFSFNPFYSLFTQYNGHDVNDLVDGLKSDRHWFVTCNTHKGYGVSFMEDDYKWHSKIVTEEQYKQALKELE